MNIYTGFLLTSSIICALLAIIVLQFNRKEIINKLFAHTFFFASYWALTDFLMFNSPNVNEAYFWNKASFLWPFTVALLFHFSLVLTKNKILNSKLKYAVIYAPAVLISFLDLTTGLVSGPIISEYWGFTYSLPSYPFFSWFGTYWSVILGIISLLLGIRYYHRVDEKNKKEQIKFIVAGLAVPFLVNVTTVVFPSFLNINLPPLGTISAMFVSIFVGYAMWKYNLFSLNPSLAAENIIDIMPDSLILTDSQGMILRVNQSFIELTNFSSEEVKEKPLTNFFIDEQKGISAIGIMVKEKKIKDFEVDFRTKSGEIRIVEFSGSIVKSIQDQNLGFACVVHDITQLKQARALARNAERLSTIGQLAITLANDLRNPLQSMQIATYWLNNDYTHHKNTPEAKKMLQTLNESINYSDNIIKQLLDYASPKTPEIKNVNINSLLTSTLEQVHPPENVELKTELAEIPPIEADEEMLKQAFLNLAENAITAMEHGGVLQVSTKRTEESVKICFRDAGVGIPREDLGELFKPMYSTKSKGMGLGLAICKKIVEAHGGSIEVESVEGRGTDVWVKLPLRHTMVKSEKLSISH